MVSVKLNNVFIEHGEKELLSKSLGQKNTRWYAAVALDLTDLSSNQKIAEWFYLMLCSPEYAKQPFKRGPHIETDQPYVVVQDQLDMDKALKIAEDKVKIIQADNWDEFYTKMSEEFLYEDKA